MATTPNWGIIGHDWAVELLQQHIATGQVRHAYLLTGPQGVGRRTLALAFAQALNCPQPPAAGQPCQACYTCNRIQNMVYPDLSLVQAELQGGVLKVDQIRSLQRSLALAPYEGRFRVALLLRFEEAHISAQNALLKTLEEPNSKVILVLTAADAESLLPTVVSRCEVLRLRPLPLDHATASLQIQLGLPTQEARELAYISNGRPGLAIQLHRDAHFGEERKECLEDLLHLITAGRVERFGYAYKLVNQDKIEKGTIRRTLSIWSTFWRDVMLSTAHATTPPTNLDWQPEIEAVAAQLDLSTAFRLISQNEETIELTQSNINLRMVLEVLLLDLPRLPSFADH